MRASSRSTLRRRSLIDLAILRARRLMRVGQPYSYEPRHARLCGAALQTYNYDTLAYLVREIFVDGCYDVGRLRARPVILDVGANIGVASLYFYLRYRGATITAVEADPDAYRLLRRNIRSEMAGSVSAVQAAAGERSGDLRLYRVPGKPGRLTNSLERERGGGDAVVVPGLRLSTLVGESVDLVKIDIEGAEHGVLLELAEAKALQRIDRIVFEMHTPVADPVSADRTLALLQRHGFSYRIAGGRPDHRWADAGEAVLVRAERARLGSRR